MARIAWRSSCETPGKPHGIINMAVATLNGMFHEEMPKFLSSKVAMDHRKVDGPWLEEFQHPVFKNYPSKEGLPHFVACRNMGKKAAGQSWRLMIS
ncbi:hypothetical protein Peur_023401 [Populus x canadensis]